MLNDYRQKYLNFNTATMRQYYLYLSGQKAELEIAPIYDSYGDLFAADAIDSLKRSLDETPEHFETEHTSIKHLLTFATEHFLENSVKQLTEAISLYEARATVEMNGRKLTFQDSAVAVSMEPNRDLRREIYDKRVAVITDCNKLRAERIAMLHDQARALGYRDYSALYEVLRQQDFHKLSLQAETVLAETETVFVDRLDEALRRDLGIKLEDAERFDASYFSHLTAYEDHFPAGQMLRVYKNTFAGLGIPVDSQKNIFIDSEPRPLKSSRASCIPISTPEDIKVVIRPVGGLHDYQSLMHEAGHAQHYGWTSAGLRPEFKHTGDYALTETYAFLFNHLVSDSAWLADMLGFDENGDFIRSEMLVRLMTLRRYGAKLNYERGLHQGEDFSSASSLYSELLTAATRFKTGGGEFLYDLDDGFYSVSYVRAWAFEVKLRDHLKSRFGQRWWASRRAGSFLKEVWETGDRYTADEMAAQIGIGPITFDPLIEEFNKALK